MLIQPSVTDLLHTQMQAQWVVPYLKHELQKLQLTLHETAIVQGLAANHKWWCLYELGHPQIVQSRLCLHNLSRKMMTTAEESCPKKMDYRYLQLSDGTMA